MVKRTFFVFALIICLISVPEAQRRKFGFNPADYPEVLQEKDFEDASHLDKLYGFIDWDLRSKDMTQLSTEFLALQAFDERTQWPAKDKRPEGFRPKLWMEEGKEPGLGIRELHKKGIRGEGVSIAVFDKLINPDHKEFSRRIHYHKIESPMAEDFQYRLHFHGMACASILCGKSLGIAPESTLHYFGVPDDGNNSYN